MILCVFYYNVLSCVADVRTTCIADCTFQRSVLSAIVIKTLLLLLLLLFCICINGLGTVNAAYILLKTGLSGSLRPWINARVQAKV